MLNIVVPRVQSVGGESKFIFTYPLLRGVGGVDDRGITIHHQSRGRLATDTIYSNVRHVNGINVPIRLPVKWIRQIGWGGAKGGEILKRCCCYIVIGPQLIKSFGPDLNSHRWDSSYPFIPMFPNFSEVICHGEKGEKRKKKKESKKREAAGLEWETSWDVTVSHNASKFKFISLKPNQRATKIVNLFGNHTVRTIPQLHIQKLQFMACEF